MDSKLTQLDMDQISAYCDGELSAAEAAEVKVRIAQDGSWREAYERLGSLGAMLDAYTAPAPSADLAARIIAASRTQRTQRPLVTRLARYLVPVAAAAAAAVLVLTFWHKPIVNNTRVAGNGAQSVRAAQIDDLVVQNLDFFRNYGTLESAAHNETVVDNATLEALDRLESRPMGM